MKRKIHMLVILSLLVSMLHVTGFGGDVNATGVDMVSDILDQFDIAARELIAMDKTTGQTRVNHEWIAQCALQDVVDNYSDITDTITQLRAIAQDGYNQIVAFDGSTAGANSIAILNLAMDLAEAIHNNGGGTRIFTTNGDFVMSYDMLGSRISDITFPGTHNSYANDEDAERNFDSLHQNQGLSLRRQLDAGIRWLDMDLGPKDGLGGAGCAIYFVHGSGTGGYVKMGDALNRIKDFAKANPEVVVIFDMSDVGTIAISDNVGYAYGKLREAIYSTGTDQYIYNMRPSAQKHNNASDVYTDSNSINPKLEDMISSGKNILFIPHSNYYPEDRAYFREIHGSGNIRQDYEATKLEERSTLTAIWDPWNLGGQSTNPLRFMSLEFDPDDGATAGSRFFAGRNNDGRRLYQNAKWYEDRMPDNKHINYFKIDFFKDSYISGNSQTAAYFDVVEACNTLNKDRFGFSISDAFTVQMTPDYRSATDILRSKSHLVNEAAVVTNNARNHVLERSEWSQNSGYIRSNGRRRHKQGSARLQWWCLPEFAIDGDFSTVWAADGTNALWFDLGAETDFDHVYIAWEYNMANPGFKILGSHNGSNWDVIYTGAKVKNTNTAFYRASTGARRYRYIKLQTTDVDNEARTGIAEIYVYND